MSLAYAFYMTTTQEVEALHDHIKPGKGFRRIEVRRERRSWQRDIMRQTGLGWGDDE